MLTISPASPLNREGDPPKPHGALMWIIGFASRVIIFGAVGLFVYGLVWNYSTRRYLTGFADAIIPLAGSPQEKTEALIAWFHNEPQRNDPTDLSSDGLMRDRDPVSIVQNTRLLKVCGTASNAFMNLADAAGLKVRRLLLLDKSGDALHVVVEVQWGDRWVVVNPSQGLIYKDHSGRALTRVELRNPTVFQDAISRMPGYDPSYTFDRTIHVRLKRIPIIGGPLRSLLDRLAPGWEEYINWAYFPENPSLWLVWISLPLLLLGLLGNLVANRKRRDRRSYNFEEPLPSDKGHAH